MVPDAHSTYIVTPTSLTQVTDLTKGGEGVREWMKTIADCAEGGDTIEKGAAATLEMLLYRSIQIRQKGKVKEAVGCGEIILKAETGSRKKQQAEIVEKIIATIAKET